MKKFFVLLLVTMAGSVGLVEAQIVAVDGEKRIGVDPLKEVNFVLGKTDAPLKGITFRQRGVEIEVLLRSDQPSANFVPPVVTSHGIIPRQTWAVEFWVEEARRRTLWKAELTVNGGRLPAVQTVNLDQPPNALELEAKNPLLLIISRGVQRELRIPQDDASGWSVMRLRNSRLRPLALITVLEKGTVDVLDGSDDALASFALR